MKNALASGVFSVRLIVRLDVIGTESKSTDTPSKSRTVQNVRLLNRIMTCLMVA